MFLYLLGGALAQALIFFPITYLSMKSKTKFRGGLWKAWLPFTTTVLVLVVYDAISKAMRLPEPSVIGIILSFSVPIAVSAAALFLTYRSNAPVN